MDLQTLHSFENNTSVATILSAYYDVISKFDLFDALQDDSIGMLGYWASINNMSSSEIFDWIDCSLNNVAKFNVIGSNDEHTDCELDLGGGVVLKFDWLLD